MYQNLMNYPRCYCVFFPGLGCLSSQRSK